MWSVVWGVRYACVCVREICVWCGNWTGNFRKVLFKSGLAVVAFAAVLSKLLTEILKQDFAPADPRIGKVLHAPQLAEHHIALVQVSVHLAMGDT